MPYTYLIGWPDLNLWYYGVRFSKSCHPRELLVSYFTSSKVVKEMISRYGLPPYKEIRKTFDCATKARLWEHKVLKRLKVINDSRFINQTDNIAMSRNVGVLGGKASAYHLAQYQEKNIMKELHAKGVATKKTRYLAGAYQESYSKMSEKAKTYHLREGYSNSGQFDSNKGKQMAARNNGQATCHCGKSGQYRAMKRWHFENCKL